MAVFNFGSINIDYVYNVDHFVAPGETLSSTGFSSILGGKGANQSVACAKAGLKTIHIGGIAKNDVAMLSPMREANVDLSQVESFDDTPSGHAIIQVTPDAENSILLFAGANHKLTSEKIDTVLDQASENDWVLLQNETNCIAETIEAAAKRGIKIAFNPAPMTKDVKNLPLDKLDLLIVNEVEAMQLTDTTSVELAKASLAQHYKDLNVVLTLGKSGVCFLNANQEQSCDAFTVEAIDTTAAGDTFIGYFLATYDKHNDVQLAMRKACAASAISVTRNGAVPSIPSSDEVDAFLEHN